jgi:AraC family transcriptional regulator of adaptative response/methylated-DNA-[protein]-cysteine methyltransferase
MDEGIMKRLPSKQAMERARLARDASFDGVFWVCVRSTGIFCRPSCPAKSPKAENVHFATSVREAVLSGFRPCKRCRPTETSGRPPEWVRQLFALSDRHRGERLPDRELRAAGIEPARARRYFRKHFGMTFQAYHRCGRLGEALGRLRDGSPPLETGLDAGYESDSGFREAFGRKFAATPGRSNAVKHVVVRMIESPVGALQLGATEDGVCLMEFADRRALPTELGLLEKTFKCAVVPGTNALVDRLEDELRRYFAGELREFTVPLEMVGTPFQRRVWDALLEIPYGATLSYGDVAEHIGRPGAQRAVGRANGTNRIAIVIPCHRVVQSDGKLRGYGGGLWRKQFLLDLEAGTGQLALEAAAAHAAVS